MRLLLVASIVSALGAVAGAAQAQEVACSSPGSVVFTGLAERRVDMVPSVHRELAGLGRLAQANNCSILITCASDPINGDGANKIRNRQCIAARQAIGMFEQRRDIRNKLTETYEMERVYAGKGAAAGQVIVTLK